MRPQANITLYRTAPETDSEDIESVKGTVVSVLEQLRLFIAGLLAGMFNSLAGGGSFITVLALMAVGSSPIAADAINTIASYAGY